MKNERSRAEVRIPDVEVLVQAAQSDVTLVSFYMPAKPDGEMEIICAICDIDEVGAICAVLEMALKALRSKNRLSLDELDTRVVSDEEDQLPF